MSALHFTEAAFAAALARGVRQCVFIGPQPPWSDAFENSGEADLQIFNVAEHPIPDLPATFVPTRFAVEPLAAALEKSNFNRLKASLFVWLGGAGYFTVDAVLASLAFIASLPEGSGILLDYATEHYALSSSTRTALDALASQILLAGGGVKQFIQPQAVTAMLRSLGFQKILDFPEGETPNSNEQPVGSGHLVSAFV